MKIMRFKEYQLVTILGLLISLSACTQSVANSTPANSNIEITTPFSESNETITATTTTSTSAYSTVPSDAELDQTCRITITYFFSVDKSFDIDAVRNIFVPSRQYFADSLIQRQTPLLLLLILPANEMWQKNHPNEPIPRFMIPEKSNQYIYFVEYTGTYAPNSTEIVPYPNSMLVIMESQGDYDCKIENYGWG